MKFGRSSNKTPERKLILETLRGMGFKPLANKQVMETQPL